MRLFISIAAVPALTLALSTTLLCVTAAAQTVEFSGTIDFVPDPGGYLDPSIQVGSPFTGRYVVDLANMATSGFDVAAGTFYPALSPLAGGVSATVASQSFAHPFAGLLIGDDRVLPPEFSGAFGDLWTTPLPFEDGAIRVGVVFLDTTTTKLSTEDLFVNQTLDGWSHAELHIIRQIGTQESPAGELLATGNVSVLTVSHGERAFNMDLGYVNGTPSSGYGAAGPTGTWNLVGFAGGELLDSEGNPSGVSATLATFSDGGSVPGPATDSHALIGDHALDCFGELLSWELLVDGLPDGDYRVWLYAPMDATVETGAVEMNGVGVASLPGDPSGALIEGTSYARVDISVSGGSIEIYSLGTGAATCAGVAGIQIQGPLPPPSVPALGMAPRALLAALLVAGAGRLRGRRHGRREADV